MQEAKKNKRKGMLGTLLFHLVLLLCFIFMGLKYQSPPPPEEGIAINFGTNDFGLGSSNKEVVEENAVDKAIESTTETEELPSQEQLETIAVQKDEKTKKNTELKEEKIEVIEEPKLNTRALYTGKKEKSNNSQGINKGNEDQGDKQGTINSENYSGSANNGNGISYQLGGRNIKDIKKPVYESQVQGRVVVSIRVNRGGKVVSANPGAKGSTTTNSYLYARAKEAALKTTFKPNQDAPEIQLGTIIYNFRLN